MVQLTVTQSKSESRSPYIVSKEFTAYRDQVEGYDLEPMVMRAGQIVFADPGFWAGTVWEGRKVVKFTCGQSRFCVERSVFETSARKTRLG